jgi:hypothetical protein
MPRRKNIPKGSAYWKDQYSQQQRRGEDKDQIERQRARRMYDKEGIDRTGKDIDHVKPLRAGGKSSKGNLRLRNPSENKADNGANRKSRTKAKNTSS